MIGSSSEEVIGIYDDSDEDDSRESKINRFYAQKRAVSGGRNKKFIWHRIGTDLHKNKHKVGRRNMNNSGMRRVLSLGR